MDIAKMYPDRIPPETVIENSDLANKESIIDQVLPEKADTENKKGAGKT